MAYRLYNKDTGNLIGELSTEQLQELIDLLEEESDDDRDYYVDQDILAFMEEEGADKALLELIRPHIGAGEDAGIEIEWREE
jgi:hypothetical protein